MRLGGGITRQQKSGNEARGGLPDNRSLGEGLPDNRSLGMRLGGDYQTAQVDWERG